MTISTRKERDKQLRQTDILSAAERVFALKGFHKATIQDIAHEAGYAIGTVYLYFKDKNTLYFSLVDEKIHDFLVNVKKQTDKVDDAQEKIRIFIRKKLEYFEENQDFFRIFLLERSRVLSVKERKFSRAPVLRKHREFIATLMKLAKKQQLIKQDYDPDQMGEIFISILMSVVFDWFKKIPRNDGSLASRSEFIFDVFFKGAGGD